MGLLSFFKGRTKATSTTNAATQLPIVQKLAAPAVEERIDIPWERIAQRAYQIWCDNGCPPGTDVRDWLQAEAELRREWQSAPKNTDPKRSR